jgi:hypothetical protein
MRFSRLVQNLFPAPAGIRMPGFDEIYYRYWYRDIGQFPGTPLQHYLEHGWKEGRDPSAGFSTDGYLAANPDVQFNGFNPLSHFLEYGISEGRKGWQKDSGVPAPTPRNHCDSRPQKLLAAPPSLIDANK